ncbi:hypothetical protein Tco_0969105 [Tanacetum coccineum]
MNQERKVNSPGDYQLSVIATKPDANPDLLFSPPYINVNANGPLMSPKFYLGALKNFLCSYALTSVRHGNWTYAVTLGSILKNKVNNLDTNMYIHVEIGRLVDML